MTRGSETYTFNTDGTGTFRANADLADSTGDVQRQVGAVDFTYTTTGNTITTRGGSRQGEVDLYHNGVLQQRQAMTWDDDNGAPLSCAGSTLTYANGQLTRQ